jgi:hypothetical protein
MGVQLSLFHCAPGHTHHFCFIVNTMIVRCPLFPGVDLVSLVVVGLCFELSPARKLGVPQS